MNTQKAYRIVLFTAIMILINYFGKLLALHFNLPIWLDSFGTAITAYVCDPFCAAIVGLSTNVIFGLDNPTSMLYGLTSIAIGISVAISAKKGRFETLFGTLTASVIVTILSVVISTGISLLVFDGKVNNVWGDGVLSFLLEKDINPYLASVIGEFYVDFFDKVITLVFLYLMIKLYRVRKSKFSKDVTTISLILFISLLWGGASVQAYNMDISNNNIQSIYSSDNGLPCGSANDVIQTNDGIIWVGTYAGLYRYNGRDFKWMSEFDSVRNVNCLYVDEEGRLWIGTNDNGLSIAINEKVINVIDEKDGLPANSVRCITQANDGNYYIGTTTSMQILTLDGGLHVTTELPEIIYAHSITADDNNNVATVTNDGNLYLIKDEEVICSKRLDAKQEIYTCALFGEDGILYVATSSNNIYRYDISSGKFTKKDVIKCEGAKNINRLQYDEKGILYVCSDNGVGYVDLLDNYYSINTGNFNNSIDNMTVDYQNNLWFASTRLGLLKLSKSSFANVYITAGLKEAVVNSVTIWNEDMYVGTDTGLDIIDMNEKKEIKNKISKELGDARVRCVNVDKDNNLWISTYGRGIIKVTPEKKIIEYNSTNKKAGDWARLVVELSDGRKLAASDIGLSYFNDKGLEKTIKNEDNLSKAMILCIQELQDGRILCGTDGDGIAIIRDDKVISRFTRQDGLSSDVILRIVEDKEDNGAYIVTSNGMCYMDDKDNIRSLENFPYYNNYDVWPADNGKVFVLSSAGVYVLKKKDLIADKKNEDFELLDSKRGLKASITANSWNYMDNENNLYLSCDSGVYRFNLDDYYMKRRSYRMMISSIHLDREVRDYERGETFEINRDVSKMEIFPEIINYSVEDPTVSYFLEGFDSSPTILPLSELSSVVYTNIPSGKYTFYLRVIDNEKKEIIEENTYSFLKENEIYDTRWFHIYMLIVAMLAVAWFTWFIARTQIQRTINFQRKQLEYARNQVKMGNETILAIAKTVDAKDENTSQHSQRVSDYSVLIARELGFTEEECENLRKAALLHDIGKIGIPDRVLNKPGKLTDEEYAIMKSHVTRGAAILKDFTLVEHAHEGTLYHHERYDGKGYPQGLKGEEIPLYGRIIGVADAFDAMTANRVYRKKMDFDYVINEFKRCRGAQFDPQMTDILLQLIEEKKIDVDKIYGSKNEEVKDDSQTTSKEEKEG